MRGGEARRGEVRGEDMPGDAVRSDASSPSPTSWSSSWSSSWRPRKGVAAEFHSNLGTTGSFAWMSSDAQWKLITFGHTLPWFSEDEGYVPQLFHKPSDPYEMRNVARENPDVVAELTAQLESEFGGSGSLARIDRYQMEQNYRLFRSFFADVLSPSELLAEFKRVFDGVSDEKIRDRVAAWEDAMSTGGAAGRPMRTATVGAFAQVEWVGDRAEGPESEWSIRVR